MNILILSPHTDDGELGAGGTIQKFLEQGAEIKWAVFSTAEESLPEDMPKDTLRNEFIAAAKSFGLDESHLIINRFAVRKLTDHRQEILELLVKIRNEFRPDLVIGPSLNDFHQDHTVIANEMVRAFKNSSSIISYELPWNHISFDAQMFVKLDRSHVEKKLEALRCYHSQIVKERAYFQRDFIEGWCRMRGTQANSEFAESFEVIRWNI